MVSRPWTNAAIVMGMIAAQTSYSAMFAICAIFPAIAVLLGLRNQAATRQAV